MVHLVNEQRGPNQNVNRTLCDDRHLLFFTCILANGNKACINGFKILTGQQRYTVFFFFFFFFFFFVFLSLI